MDQLTTLRPNGDARAPLPPEAPLAMPEQDLRRFDRRQARRPRRDRRAIAMRAILVAGSIALTAWFAVQMHQVLAVGGLVALEAVMLGLFVVNIGWIGFNTVSALLGLVAPRPPEPAPRSPVRTRTAILLPTFNEDPAGVIGGAIAILEDIAARGAADRFDLFVLSDTTKPDVWLAEQALVDHARRTRGLEERLWYRHRSVNRARKVGNVTDWVERWGGAYPFMLVLDADSLMAGDTVLELARRLEADPDAGMIQTAPALIGGRTPLARLQQFAGRVYGPMLTRGLAAWFGDAGNYWGHNAILRTQAVAAAAGLPILPGGQPFGGLILSHDFVEAALLRRAGWGVRLAADLGGSYERSPPNLIEMVTRDRRWAQGNLQHLALLRTAGLHWLNRLHMATGALAYLAAPLWLLFLLAGMALALYASLVPPTYFPDGWALFPTWPQIDAQRAITLFGLCLLLLYTPKLLGLALFLRDPASRGQRLRAAPDLLAEVVISALTAPILMLTQTRAVFEILAGRDSGWNAQARESDRMAWSTIWRFHRRHMMVGAILAVAAGAISWSLLAWMSPALLSMLIAAPVGKFLGSNTAGDWMRRRRLLGTPEERCAPDIARAAAAAVVDLQAAAPAPAGLAALVADPAALARHVAWLDVRTERRRGEPDPTLAAAWLRVTEGAELHELDDKQSHAILASAGLLRRIVEGERSAAVTRIGSQRRTLEGAS